MSKRKDMLQNIICALLALVSMLALNMRNTLYEGFCAENGIGNLISRCYNTFQSTDYTDIIVVIAFHVFFLWVLRKQQKICISGAIVSFFLAFSYVLAMFYRNFDSTEFLFGDTFQTVMALFEITGIGILIYFLLSAADYYFNGLINKAADAKENKVIRRLKNNFFIVSVHFIFICWLVWLLLTYPGSVNPDSIIQLRNFYGDLDWTAWQPPFSTMIMGGLFHLGKSMIDANFGMFLYNFFQGLAGALVFSYALSRLVKRGVPFMIPVCGMLFFGLTPMWGAYVQWFEKDFLFTVAVVLFTALISEIVLDRACSVKMLICICLSGILMALLRNNGIYVIIPTLIGCIFYLKGKDCRKIISGLVIILVGYILVTKALYPALGIGKTSPAETMGFMLQATARYVQEYPDEVTEFEKEVLSNNLVSYDALYNYEPRISDPVKIYYTHADFGSYIKIWFQMFFKHPMVYIESYLNGAYGYMAPVSRDIGAYINLDGYDTYLRELGVEHPDNGNLRYLAVWIWNTNLEMPLIKYTVSPGLYTWLTVAALWLMIKNKRKVGIILAIPNLINILVCTASPLADAMRYALPTVAVMPLLIGWIFLLFGSNNRNETADNVTKSEASS